MWGFCVDRRIPICICRWVTRARLNFAIIDTAALLRADASLKYLREQDVSILVFDMQIACKGNAPFGNCIGFNCGCGRCLLGSDDPRSGSFLSCLFFFFFFFFKRGPDKCGHVYVSIAWSTFGIIFMVRARACTGGVYCTASPLVCWLVAIVLVIVTAGVAKRNWCHKMRFVYLSLHCYMNHLLSVRGWSFMKWWS